MGAARAWLGAALLGCGGGAGQDAPARAYAEASALAPSDPLAAAARCAEAAPAVRDECRAFSARAAPDPGQAAAICASMGEGAWRDECWFLVAEARARTEGAPAAVESCGAAGRFAGQCLDHLWRAHATALLTAHDPAAAAARYADARAWAEGRGEGSPSEVDARFWMAFYDAPLHDPGLPPLDAAWCGSMEGAVGAACAAHLGPTLWKTLVRLERERQVQVGGVDRRRLCGGGPPAAAVQGAFGLRWVEGPALDAVAGRFVGARCR